MNLTIKKILAVLGFIAVAILAVTRAGAECPVDPWHFGWSFSGTAYYDNSGNVWVELSPWHSETNSLSCKSECPIEQSVVTVVSWSVKRAGTPIGGGDFIPGEMWNVSSYGAGSPYACSYTGYVLYNSGQATTLGYAAVQKVIDDQAAATLYLGRVTNGSLGATTCTDANLCSGVVVGGQLLWYGVALRSFAWDMKLVHINTPPGNCHPECQQLEKVGRGMHSPRPELPMGVERSTWSTTKELYR